MMTDKNASGTGSRARPSQATRDLLRANEVAAPATPNDLLRAPEGELRRFAKANQPGKGKPRPGLRPKFLREW